MAYKDESFKKAFGETDDFSNATEENGPVEVKVPEWVPSWARNRLLHSVLIVIAFMIVVSSMTHVLLGIRGLIFNKYYILVVFLGILIYGIKWHQNKTSLDTPLAILKTLIYVAIIVLTLGTFLDMKINIKTVGENFRTYLGEKKQVNQQPPKNYINCPRGAEPTFQLKAGEYSPYMRVKYGTNTSFQSKNGKYKICYRSGKCFTPSNVPAYGTEDFRYYAITNCYVRAVFK